MSNLSSWKNMQRYCRRGHRLTLRNRVPNAHGSECRICRRARQRARYRGIARAKTRASFDDNWAIAIASVFGIPSREPGFDSWSLPAEEKEPEA